MQTRPPTGTIPDAPGSYQFLDREGRVLYVGKAKSLRHRLPNYWADPLAPRTAQMMALADRVEWVVVDTEVDALILEHSLIQTHLPRFNVRLKDDKSYPWLAVTVSDEWPRPMVFRGKKRKGVRYFGPYGHVGALRETIDLLLRSFPVRTCSDAKFQRHHRLGRPCLLYDIERCSGPCVGAVDAERYAQLVEELMRFLSGETAPVVARLVAEMTEAADSLEYEQAARLRDRLSAVRKAAETQQMVSERPEDLDVVGIAEDELEAAVQVFFVRRGRVVGRKGFVADKVEDLHATPAGGAGPGGALRRPGRGGAAPGAPARDARRRRRCTPPGSPGCGAGRRSWRCRCAATSGRCTRPSPATRPRTWPATGCKRAGDHNSRARALTELQSALGLAQAPLRIECFDMSHLQGTDYVGSMVVFEDGLAKKSDYRRFKVKTRARATTTTPPWRRCCAGACRASLAERADRARGAGGRRGRACGGHRAPPGGRAPALRLPAPAPPARRRQGPARGRRSGSLDELGLTERDRAGRTGQAVRGGLPARDGRSRPHPPGLRGPLPPAAGPRRGAPLRHHVPPRATGQPDDGRAPLDGDPGPRPDPPEAPAGRRWAA